MTLALAAVALYYSWVYSKMEIDPDWSMFNLWGFVGARYGRDFVDCKMPAIHLWYLGIRLVVGDNIQRVKFTHHLLISLPGVIVGGWAGLLYIVFINSGQLMAFHGNVGCPAAAALFLAMWLDNPIASSLLALLAVAFEPKLVVSSLLLSLVSGWGVPFVLLAALAGAGGLSLKWLWPEAWGYLWEANIVIPKRMVKMRKDLLKEKAISLFPPMIAHGLMYTMPWVTLAVVYTLDVLYWLPVVAYIVLIACGIVIRPNHFIVVAPWVALSGMPGEVALALCAATWIASGFYIGDLWERFYLGLRKNNIDARAVGEFLRDKPGSLWVNSYHTAVYIYSRKMPLFGMVEQIEIRENATERRNAWYEKINGNLPDWVVEGPAKGWRFNTANYYKVAEGFDSVVWRKATA